MPRRELDDETARAFGRTVRDMRLRKKLTTEDVAGRIKRRGRDRPVTTLDPKYLQNIEAGYHSPSITLAVQIAHALDVSLAALVVSLPVLDVEAIKDADLPDELDRKQLAELLEVSQRTLTDWVREGIINPHRGTRNGRTVQLFSREQFARARAFRVLEKQHHGQMTRHMLVEILDSKRDRPDWPVSSSKPYRGTPDSR